MHTTLCLTATIVPHTTHVARSDVAQRLEDYKSAIRFYLKYFKGQIAFIENSDFDLDSDREISTYCQEDHFNVYRFKHHPETDRGKGFQEFYMLDEFVRVHLNNPYLIKVTGRYLIHNIAQLAVRMEGPLCIDLHRKLRVAQTTIFGVDREAYLDHLADCYAEANDDEGRFIEHVVYDKIANSTLAKRTNILPENPLIEGISGSHGASMERNPYKMKVRTLERWIYRSMGIGFFPFEY